VTDTMVDLELFEQVVRDEYIECESGQCHLPRPHRAKYAAHVSCGDVYFGCQKAFQMWMVLDMYAFGMVYCHKCNNHDTYIVRTTRLGK